jgi:hypothetical protein
MLETIWKKIRRIPPVLFIVLGIILTAAILRIKLYGDPSLSIANNDTISYVRASRVPLFSSEIMTGRRLLTTNLIYKALVPNEFEITANGSLSTSRRMVQPGFGGVVQFQLILSIIGWGFLALTVAQFLKNPLMKVLGSTLVVLFAFTPHMADWDSILMSESPTFSLFALHFALLIRLVFALYRDPDVNAGWLLAAWAVVFFLWMFLRDTNLVTALVTLGVFAALLIFRQYRRNKYLLGVIVFLLAVFLLGLITSSQSVRSHVQLVNIYNDDLLQYPARVDTLMELGMPDPDSPEYSAWFKEHASSTLVKFMMRHPGYPIHKILKDFPVAFSRIQQTYFKAPELNPAREWLMRLGEALHPENTTPFLMSLTLLVGILYITAGNQPGATPWSWLGIWLFLNATVTMIPTILGDTWALNRHALFSTMSFRLGMWLFAVILMDLALETNLHKTDTLSEKQA